MNLGKSATLPPRSAHDFSMADLPQWNHNCTPALPSPKSFDRAGLRAYGAPTRARHASGLAR
jgi:hypothetical protein